MLKDSTFNQHFGEFKNITEKLKENFIRRSAENKNHLMGLIQIEAEDVDNFNELTEKFREILNINESELLSDWKSLVDELCESLSDEIKLPEDESHFESNEEETFTLKLGKQRKRAARRVKKGAIAVGNLGKKLAKKDPVQYSYPTRTVKIKNLSRAVLYDISPEITDQFIAEKRGVTECISGLISLTTECTSLNFEECELLAFVQDCREKNSTLSNNLDAKFGKAIELAQNQFEKKYAIAGTMELPEQAISEEKLADKFEEYESDFKDSKEHWDKLLSAEFRRLITIRELVTTRLKIRSLSDQLHSDVTEQEKNVYDAHQSLKNLIDSANAEIGDSKRISVTKLRSLSNKLKKKSSALFADVFQTELGVIQDEKLISSKLHAYTTEVTELSKSLSDKSVLLQISTDLSERHPKYTIREVEWKTFIKRMLGEYLAVPLLPSKLQPEDKYEELQNGYEEVIQIIETSLTLKDEVTTEDEEAPVEVLTSGLKRASARLDELLELLQTESNSYIDLINDQLNQFTTKITEFLQKQDLSEMKWLDTQLKVKQSAGGWKTKFTVLWASFLDRVSIIVRFITQRYTHYSDEIRGWLGLSSGDEKGSQTTSLAAFLYETDRKIESLPFVYRRLFDFKREVEESLLIYNPIELDKCKKALDLARNNFPSAVAVIGEKGSGKTTLIRHLSNTIFKDEKQFTYSFIETNYSTNGVLKSLAQALKLQETETASALVEKIKKRRKGTVVTIENIQNVYLRTMNGYDGLNTLLYIISATKHEVLWVVSSSKYAWEFLEVAMNISDYFTHLVKSDGLTPDEIEELILRRQRASGYQLWFNADTSTLKSRSYQKLLDDEEAAQDYLRERYFEKLSKMAEGNATVAMILWIRSIKEYDENYFTIEPFDFTSTERFDGMDTTALFVLSAFIRHDTLTPEELSKVMNTNCNEAEMMISRLSSRGLLLQSDKQFELNDLIYRQVVRLMKTKNILH